MFAIEHRLVEALDEAADGSGLLDGPLGRTGFVDDAIMRGRVDCGARQLFDIRFGDLSGALPGFENVADWCSAGIYLKPGVRPQQIKAIYR